MPASPPGLLLAYDGDDFTGAADVLEALASAGYPTVLFLQPPTPTQLSRYPGLRAFGIAGGSRTMSVEQMDRELPPALEALRDSGARFVHYKLCSTFDSSVGIGSIGHAMELGREVFGRGLTPLVVGLPLLGRYVAFGNLFARSGLDSEPHRLDRHPTMSRHPVTPMKEADLRRVLADQTSLPVRLVDVLALESALEAADGSLPALPAPDEPGSGAILLFDTLRDAHLAVIGQTLEQMAVRTPLFVAGSSAVEHALVAHWTAAGSSPPRPSAPPAEAHEFSAQDSPGPLVVLSGSCSPVTGRQIATAVAEGFAEFALDPAELPGPGHHPALAAARSALAAGRSVVLHTSLGPTDPRFQRALGPAERDELGWALGRMLDPLLRDSGARRAVVCGGDTSMAVARALGIEALEFVAPAAPGCPLCRVHAPGRAADGREMVFKGGQNGRDRLLLDVASLASVRGSGSASGNIEASPASGASSPGSRRSTPA